MITMDDDAIKYTPIEPEGIPRWAKFTSIVGYELAKFALASSIIIFNTVNALNMYDTFRYRVDRHDKAQVEKLIRNKSGIEKIDKFYYKVGAPGRKATNWAYDKITR